MVTPRVTEVKNHRFKSGDPVPDMNVALAMFLRDYQINKANHVQRDRVEASLRKCPQGGVPIKANGRGRRYV